MLGIKLWKMLKTKRTSRSTWKIYLALKEKDSELASKLMKEHLEFSGKFLEV